MSEQEQIREAAQPPVVKTLRPWPIGATGNAKGKATKQFVAAYRRAFALDPDAKYCAGEVDGLTIIVAVGPTALRLQRFVRDELGGIIEQRALTGGRGAAASKTVPAPSEGET